MKYLIFKRWFLKYLRWFLKVASERMGSKLGWRRRRRGKNASSGRTRFLFAKNSGNPSSTVMYYVPSMGIRDYDKVMHRQSKENTV